MKRLTCRTWILAIAWSAACLWSLAVAEEETAAPWHDAAQVEALFAEACDVVERVSGSPYANRPRVRISTPAEVGAIVRQELKPILEAAGRKDRLDAYLRLLGRAMLAKYEPNAHIVHLIAERLDETEHARLPDGRPDMGVLRVLLAHEAAHAHDWHRYGWSERLSQLKDPDALRAFDAVIEGHAQYVSKRVARLLGIPAAFGRVTESIVTPPPVEHEMLRPVVEAVTAMLVFGYVQGHAFIEAVAAARGPEGLEALLRDPPTTTRAIESPDEYLHPPAEGDEALDLARAVEAFRPLVGDEAWKVETSRVPRAVVAAMARAVPEEHREAFLAGFLDGHVLVGRIPAENRQVMALVTHFRSPADAKAFLVGERAAQEAKDAAGGVSGIAVIEDVRYAEGAGREGRLPGFTGRKVVKAGRSRVVVTTHSFAIGRVAGQIMTMSTPEVDRAAEDAAIERFARYLADPEAADAANAFAAPAVGIERTTRRLTLEVRGPDGAPVVEARAVARAKGVSRSAEVIDGRAEIDMPKEKVSVTVWMARDASGTPLNLAPVIERDIPADRVTVGVEMKPGATISGRVTEEGGAGGAGAEIEARPAPDGGPRGLRLGSRALAAATADAEGAFRLVGLVPGHRYALQVRAGKDYVPVSGVEADAGDAQVRVSLQVGRRLTVRVVDGEGRPVAGAALEIEEIPAEAGESYGWMGVSGADGRARLPALAPESTYDLRIQPPRQRRDLARLRDPSWIPADGAIALAPGFTARGVVRDEDGMPARARVDTEGRRIERGNVVHLDNDSAETDGDGRFEIHHLPARPVRLRAKAFDDYGWPRSDDEGVEEASPDRPDVELTLPKRATLRVRVVDVEGRPVPRARTGLRQGARTTLHEVRAGAARISLPMPEEGGQLIVFDARDESDVRLPLGPTVAYVEPGDREVLVRLRVGASIAGRVIGPRGQGVADARIRWEVVGEAYDGILRHADAQEEAFARTNEDGSFRLVGLAKRSHRISVIADGYADLEPRTVKPGTEDVVLEVGPGGTFTVLVEDAEGRPLAGASVVVRVREALPRGGTKIRRLRDLRTNAEGVSTVAHIRREGGYDLRVDPPSGGSALVPFESPWKPADTTVRLEAGFYVTGTVVDFRGTAVVGGRIRAVPGFPGRSRWRPSFSGAGGRFRVGPFRRGPVRLRALPPSVPSGPSTHASIPEWDRAARLAPTTLASPEASEVVLTLPPRPGPVTIRVVGAATQRDVWLRRLTGEDHPEDPFAGTRSYETDEHGVLTIRNLMPGRYALFVDVGPDGRLGYLAEVGLPGPEVKVELLEALAIRIRLVLPEGSRHIEVHVEGPIGPRPVPRLRDGTYLASELPPGRWRVRAKVRAPHAWLRQTVEVEAGAEVEIDLRE